MCVWLRVCVWVRMWACSVNTMQCWIACVLFSTREAQMCVCVCSCHHVPHVIWERGGFGKVGVHYLNHCSLCSVWLLCCFLLFDNELLCTYCVVSFSVCTPWNLTEKIFKSLYSLINSNDHNGQNSQTWKTRVETLTLVSWFILKEMKQNNDSVW